MQSSKGKDNFAEKSNPSNGPYCSCLNVYGQSHACKVQRKPLKCGETDNSNPAELTVLRHGCEYVKWTCKQSKERENGTFGRQTIDNCPSTERVTCNSVNEMPI